ncbi:MAG: hypothetical protein PHD88_10210 [Firmicutes bacterium]|nr:hypothetical protein [Bacillota bacterium]
MNFGAGVWLLEAVRVDPQFSLEAKKDLTWSLVGKAFKLRVIYSGSFSSFIG